MYFCSVILIRSGIDCNDATRFDFNRQPVVWGEPTNYFGNAADFFHRFQSEFENIANVVKKQKPYFVVVDGDYFSLNGQTKRQMTYFYSFPRTFIFKDRKIYSK